MSDKIKVLMSREKFKEIFENNPEYIDKIGYIKNSSGEELGVILND